MDAINWFITRYWKNNVQKKHCDDEGTLKEQWAMVGDTFLVGCKSPENIIFPEFNKENPDMLNEKYNNEVGIYSYGWGIDNGHCFWGHDESLSSSKNPNKLPAEALYIERLYSLYAYPDKE